MNPDTAPYAEHPDGLLPVLNILPYPCAIEEGLALDRRLLNEVAAAGGRRAGLWSSEPALVVSTRDTRLPGYAEAAAWVARTYDMPVVVRATGGTAVVQGPDVLTLSLAFEPEGQDLNAAYDSLRAVSAAALSTFTVEPVLAAVDDAYCDGAHNIVVDGRKLAGTAQRRRRGTRPAVLVHAALSVFDDLGRTNDIINGFYAAAGAPTAYRADVCTNLQSATYARGQVIDSQSLTVQVRQSFALAALDWIWDAPVSGAPVSGELG